MKYTIEEITNWLNKHGLMGHSLVRDLSEENVLAANPHLREQKRLEDLYVMTPMVYTYPCCSRMIEDEQLEENPCKDILIIDGPTSVAEYHKRKTEDIPQKYDPNVCPADNFEPFNDGIPL